MSRCCSGARISRRYARAYFSQRGSVHGSESAHFTTAEPDYKRDEKFQRHYAEAAGSEETWAEFVKTYLSGTEADYQAAVRKFAEAQAAKKEAAK